MAHKRRPATGRQLDRAPAGGDSLGPVRFGSKSADYSRATIQRPWFAHYLHGKGDGPLRERLGRCAVRVSRCLAVLPSGAAQFGSSPSSRQPLGRSISR